jgi:voltage-gated potassium channel
MTTVGYGDELPATVEARWVALFLMVVGIGCFAVVTGMIAERFMERGEGERVEAVQAEAPDDLGAEVDRLALRARERVVAELEARCDCAPDRPWSR